MFKNPMESILSSTKNRCIEGKSMANDQKAMLVTMTIAAFDGLRKTTEPDSAAHTRLTRAIKKQLRLMDLYRHEAWAQAKLNKASAILDEYQDKLHTLVDHPEHEKNFHAMLQLALAAFETIRADEVPKTTIYLKLNSAIDYLIELLSIFTPGDCPNSISNAAGDLVDDYVIRIKQVFA